MMQQARQRECAELVVRLIRIEHATVSTRFVTLRDDRVHARRFQLACFLYAGRRGQQHDAGLAQGRDLRAGWHAEVKAHHPWLFLDQHGKHLLVYEKGGIDLMQALGRRGSRLLERSAQALKPRALLLRVGPRGPMDEHVHIERPLACGAELADRLACRGRVHRAHAQRTEAARVAHGGGHRR
jgi:hypothetical protein